MGMVLHFVEVVEFELVVVDNFVVVLDTLVQQFVELVQEQGTPVGKPKMEGNSLVLMVEPTAKK